MNRLLRISLLAALAILLVPSVASAAISPTPTGGARWGATTLRVYDRTPALYREGVTIAMRTWNQSRIGITLVRTTNRRAAHIVIGTKLYPGSVAGTGTLGAARPAVILLDTNLVATEPIIRNGIIQDFPGGAIPEEIADVATHEFGHVLGLRHTTGCSLMVVRGNPRCGYAAPPSGMWNCRLVQRRDLLALKRRYRGTGVLRRSLYCPLSATRSGRVGAVAAGASTRTRAYSVDWRNTTNTYGYRLARSAVGGPCPTSPTGGELQRSLDASSFSESWSTANIAAGTYCVSIWSVNGRGTLSAGTTKVVTVTSPDAAPVTSFDATATGSDVTLTWTQPAGTQGIRIYRYESDGTCRVPAFTPVIQRFGGTTTSAIETGVSPGTWTWAITRTDDPADDEETDWSPQFASSPVCDTSVVA